MGEVSLTSWMKALIAYVRSGEPDLTNRQMPGIAASLRRLKQ